MYRDRFAPSPTGRLHLGHAFSALTAWENCRQFGGEFILRIEDIDTERSHESYVDAIFEDLEWLGLSWPSPVMRQSERIDVYERALVSLIDLGICYPCRCTRRDIQNALMGPQESSIGESRSAPEKRIYPGICRHRSIQEVGPGDSIRLDMKKAIDSLGGREAARRISYRDVGPQCGGLHFLDPDNLIDAHGDIVLARRDIRTSYHLAVVVDDHCQDVTCVSRGKDLFGVTPIHRLLQVLLQLEPPVWHHHRLIRDEHGQRLAKRAGSTAISEFRKSGHSVRSLREKIGL
ncbi:MAG: tRNA glutamyl-Q(34) synthetase GluQRS [Rhodobacteraceae bacterium]|nr:tRNA glutamyl-Q(34) synthetase GluQRS [Paracoccaceae bacterium]MCY4197810.1 tRNA glutamyl-Q(34) synthetase GluQRS [Paracoccaceae bacterium]MCY4326533.1 tRNA glutamyl-Q(34) synthetase GluQRS [Paracoccaceae bacterium]